MTVDHFRLNRILTRCGETAGATDCDTSVKRVYDELLVSEAMTYRGAYQALMDAEKKAKKELREALKALVEIDQPYRKARTVTLLYVKDLAVPETLKSLDTDTDRKDAISTLLGILDEHDDEPGWAQDLTAGEFGRLAPEAIRELDELIKASSDLEKAMRARAKAYGPAYEAYLGFKQVVRNAYGASSRHYRRIHVKSNGKLAEDDPVDTGDPKSES